MTRFHRPHFHLPFHLPNRLTAPVKRGLKNTRTVVAIGAGVILLMVVPLVIWQLHSPFNKAQAAWFNTQWSYRQRIPLSNSSGTNMTNFQVELTGSSAINTASLISAGKMQSACQDMRFTDINGKLLPFWIEPGTCNTSSTIVWINVPSIPSQASGGTADIYFYYGNPSVAAASYNTSQVFIRDMTSAAAAWPLDDTTTTQSYARVQNPALSTGRNLDPDPGFDTAGSWTAGTGWSITGSQAVASSASGDLTLTTGILITGRVYKITYTVLSYSSGSIRSRAGTSAANGTIQTANGTYTDTLVATGTQLDFNVPSTFTGDLDNVTVTELNIPASGATPTQLLTDGNMEMSGVAAWTAINSATLTKQTTNPHGGTQSLRVAYNASNNPQAQQSILITGSVYRAYGYARGDGTAIPTVSVTGSVIWTGTTSTTWQPFDVVFVAPSSAFQLRTQISATGYSEFDDVTVALDTGIRSDSILSTLDGDMEQVGTAYWVVSTAGTITKDTTSPHGGTQNLRIARSSNNNPTYGQSILNTGKTYHLTGWWRGDGSAVANILTTSGIFSQSSTSSNSWQHFDFTFVANGVFLFFRATTSTGTQYAEFDDLTLNEVPPMVGIPTNGVLLGQSAAGHLTNAYSFDGTNDVVNIYSGTLNSDFNPSEGTVVVWAKVSGSGVWTDATLRYLTQLQADSNDLIYIRKSTTSNTVNFDYTAGGTTQTVNAGSQSSTGWIQLALTWSKTSNQVIAYINGAQVGSTQTGLGTWVGNLASTQGANIGALNASGSSPWSGLINDYHLYNSALSSAQIFDLYGNGTIDRQAYYTENDPGHELIRQYSTGVTVGAFATEEDGSGPLVDWHFDEATGTTAHDVSTNADTGTLGGTTLPTWQTSDQCVSNTCLFFDGQSSIVTGSKVATGVESVGFWIRPSNIGKQGIVNLDGGTHKISTNETGVLSATGFTSPTYYVNGVVTTTPTLTLGQWNYVVITTGTSFNTTSSFTVGTDGTTFAGGYIDEFKAYNYARSAAQVQTSYNLGAATIKLNPPVPLNGLVADWPLDDTTSTQSYARVVDPGATTGRNIVLNGTFDSTSNWTTQAGWTIANGVAHNDGTGSAGNSTFETVPIVAGRAYQITYTVANYVQGQFQVQLGSSSATGGVRTSNGTFTDTLIPAQTGSIYLVNRTTPQFIGDVDNVTLTELNIPSSTATPTQLLADGNMEASGTSAWTAANGATLTKQTTNPHLGSQLLRVAGNQNSDAVQNVVTSGQVYRAYGYARSDGTGVPKVTLGGVAVFTGTTSTTWQPFDGVVVAGSNVFALLDNTNSTYVEFDDVTVALDTAIRSDSILSTLDGNMELSGTSYWTAGNSATLTKDTAAPHSGTNALKIAYNGTGTPFASQNIFALGKTYHVTGWAKGDGTYAPKAGNTGSVNFTGTTSTSWQFFDFTFVANNTGLSLAATATAAGYAEFDDVTTNEIPPLVGVNTNGVTVGAASGGHLTNAYSFDGTNDVVNIYSGSLNSVFNPSEGTYVIWAKVANSGVWTDGLNHALTYLEASGSNEIIILKGTSNNNISINYQATTTSTVNIPTGGTTGWFQIAVSWSASANQMKVYYNGAQSGSTQVMPATAWVGNLSSTLTAIGAPNSTGTTAVWSGLMNDARLYNRALSPAEIQQLYSYAPGPVAYWKMDEGTGSSAFDSSGNGYTGTISDTSVVKWVTGEYGRGISLPGTSNKNVSVGNISALEPSDGYNFTVEGWVNIGATGGQAIFGNRDSTSNTVGTQGWGINIATGGTSAINFIADDGTNGAHVSAATNQTVGQWNYFTAVFQDSGTMQMYINGVLSATTTTGVSSIGSLNSGNSIKIGSRPSGNNAFTGSVDDFKFYNYARSAAQIADDMRGDGSQVGEVSNVGGTATNTQPASALGYWKFDEGYGTTANNAGSVGSAVNGTLTNMASPATSTSGWQPASSGNCKINGCLAYDASNDYVTMGTAPSLNVMSGDFSVSTWVKTSQTGTTRMILQKGSGPTIASDKGYSLYLGSSGTAWSFGVWDGVSADNSALTPISTYHVDTTNWHLITGVFINATKTANLYVDGVLVKSVTGSSYTAPDISANNLVIGGSGNSPSGSVFWSGNIDEPKVYNFALTTAEVQNDYNADSAVNFGTTASSEASQLTDTAGAAPVGYWNMEEGTGATTNDISGNGQTGTLTNSPVWSVGKYGSGLLVSNANNSYVSFTSTSNLSSTPVTTSIWFKPLSGGTTNGYVLGANGGKLFIKQTSGSNLSFQTFDGTNTSTCTTTDGKLADNNWHYLTLTYDGTTTSGYVDGKFECSATGAAGNLSLSAITWNLGARPSTASDTGYIDEVKMYNYARTQGQIEYDYNRGTPIGWWKLDECQGTVAHDSSATGNNGTITIGGTGSQTSPGTCNDGLSTSAWNNGKVGKFNSSLNFDGTDDYVQLANLSGVANTNTFTISAWVKTTSTSNLYLYGEASSSSNTPYIGLEMNRNSTGDVAFEMRDDSSDFFNPTKSGLNSNDGNWHMVTGVRESNSVFRVYFDGKLVASKSSGTPPATTTLTTGCIGALCRATKVGYVSGQVDDVRVYNYGLSASQVQELYNNGAGVRFGPSSGSP